MTNIELAKALREDGFTYEAVGRLLGVSKQRVHQLLHKGVSNRVSLGKKIIYPNLLEWSIEHKCNRAEFLCRMGYTADKANSAMLCRVLNGKQIPKKDLIDKMLQATGLSYEKLFWVMPNAD